MLEKGDPGDIFVYLQKGDREDSCIHLLKGHTDAFQLSQVRFVEGDGFASHFLNFQQACWHLTA